MTGRRSAHRAFRLALLGFAPFLLAACGTPPVVQHHDPVRPVEPSWEALFSPMPELVIALRPRSISRDPVYGRFFQELLVLARAEGRLGGESALRAVSDAEEVIVGLSPEGRARGLDDAIAVLRGVPADIDPLRITDARGEPLLNGKDGPGLAREYVVARTLELAGDAPDASVFVLPRRTWIIALGQARSRARKMLSAARPGTAPVIDPTALAALRLDARSFARRRGLDRSATFASLVRGLADATLALGAGQTGATLTLRYADARTSDEGAAQVRRWLEEFSKVEQTRAPTRSPTSSAIGWLRGARLSREGNNVIAHVELPARLLEELPHASGAELMP